VTITESDTETLMAEMRQLRADVSRVMETLHHMFAKRGSEAFGSAQDAASKFFEEARTRTGGLAREIEARPVAAALGALGLGMMLGILFSGRRT
jgi:ElaB/YqjD/DUF883 family membrane-anchored ribosome-binding protein